MNSRIHICFKLSLVIGLALILIASQDSFAQDSRSQRQQQLERLEKEIKLLEERIANLRSSERTTARTLEELKTKRRLHDREVERIGLEILSTEDQISDLEPKIDDLSISLQARQEELGRILRKMYIGGRSRMLRALLSVPEAEQMGLAQTYLSIIAKGELKFIKTYQSDLENLTRQQRELRQAKSDLVNLHEQERKHSEDALSAQTEQENILTQIRSKQGVYTQALQEKMQARQRLQQLIERVTTAETAVTGIPFSRQRGRLPWPADGEVITRFGKVRDTNYDVVLENDGIDIRANVGNPVYAVFAGNVVFRDWIDERGNMVVLDHGNGYYTLYAHLDRFSVEKSDEVVAGQEIGKVGETGSLKGSILHFEIRQHALALDPAEWLSKKP